MSAPYVGLPTTADLICGYGGLDITSTTGCTEPPTVHLAVDAPGWGTVGLATCARHEPIARASGNVIGAHPYGPSCAETPTEFGAERCTPAPAADTREV